MDVQVSQKGMDARSDHLSVITKNFIIACKAGSYTVATDRGVT
jgi:hypothetical protein